MEQPDINISFTAAEAEAILAAREESGRPGFYQRHYPIWNALRAIADKIEGAFSVEGFDYAYDYDSGDGVFTTRHPVPTYADGTTCACKHPLNPTRHHSADNCRSVYADPPGDDE